jgi:hypothetical protein
MATLWLHVGQPKTGTSALQVSFARNARAFWNQGAWYPWGDNALGGEITSGNAEWLARWEGDFPDHLQPAQDLAQVLASGRSAVLSSEWLCYTHDGLLREMKARFPATKILAYLRDPVAMTIAHHIHGRTRNPTVWTGPLSEFAADHWCLRFVRQGEYLDWMANLFGAENMAVRSYRQARSRLPQDAVEAMGFSPKGFDFTTPEVNPTLPFAAPDRAVVAGLREISAPEMERVVREWFPGQTIEEVYGQPVR